MIAADAGGYNPAPVMRLFLAINLPGDALDHLTELQTSLRECLHSPADWTKRPQLHVTLKFIGEVHDAFVSSLKASLVPDALPRAFDLRATALEAFPNQARARILAAKLTPADTEPLTALHRRFEDACAALDVLPENRPFRPHTTLARMRVPRRLPESVRAATAAAFPGPPFRVATVDLMRSTLSHTGASYECLHRFELR